MLHQHSLLVEVASVVCPVWASNRWCSNLQDRVTFLCSNLDKCQD